MQYYRIEVAYQGTDFFGWQSQKVGKTVVQTMQDCFFKTFYVPCTILGVSRTDSGVHAEGQVALVTTVLAIDEVKLQHAWNKSLPHSILIRTCKAVTQEFNPFYGIVSKTYQYTIFKNRPDPFIAPFGWHYNFELDQELLQKALLLFIGTHDFSAFSTFEPGVDTVRTIDSITVRTDPAVIVITISGKSFIRHMIRRIVGAAVLVGAKQKRTIVDIEQLLEIENKKEYNFQTAPACGLCLVRIYYKK